MITTPFGKRSAEQFDDLLEGRVETAPTELTDLLAFAEQVWAVPAPEPRADFSATLRARLMAEAPAALANGATDHRLTVTTTPAAKGRQRRVAAAVAVLSIAGAATGTAFAAEDTLPGDTLYPVKRLVESAHATLSFGDKAKGSVELSQATTRLGEAATLAKAGNKADAADALSDFVSQATKGSDLLTSASEGADIHAFTTSSLPSLSALSDLLPADVLAPVLQALLSIDKAATAAFPDAGDGISDLPTSLVRLLSDTTAAITKPGSALGGATPSKKPTAGASTAPGSATHAGTAPTAPAKPGRTPGSTPTSIGGALGDTVSGVGSTVGGVVGGLGDTLGQVGSALPSPVGGVVGGLGDTVNGVGDGVGGLLNGVGGLLGGSTPTSKP